MSESTTYTVVGNRGNVKCQIIVNMSDNDPETTRVAR